ncbi:MAG: alpha/beta fold hydrolase [Desulfobacteraceae bacterium]|jgi:pimeloyl-ACP methyl ester carboxylesterase
MANFPSDFDTIIDSGGLGEGHEIGGFGGNPDGTRGHHREFIRSSGKAPIVLVHGNSGTATHPNWGWLKVANILKSQFNYSDEHLWALSYLGPGNIHEINDPYSKNIDDLRHFADNVRTYLDVDCIDIVGHSMGCHLILCYLAGLKKQSDPIKWDQGERYANVGSVILIDGAMQGLSQFTLPGFQPEYDEWLVGHDVYQCIRPDHTPHGKGDPPTPDPAHNIKYWCCMVPGGFVDGMDNNRHVTGHLDGADENLYYDAGWGREGHERVKDNPAFIQDWAVHLNTRPPTDPVTITIDQPSGSYSGELMITVSVDPEATTVHYEAKRVTKTITLGTIETQIGETPLIDSLSNGQTLTLATEGMWEVVFTADGAQDITRTYWIDVVPPQVEIITDDTVPFENTLEVQAETNIGTLFMNNSGVDGDGWQRISKITITEDSVIKAIAITSAGIASDIVTKKFKQVVHEQAVGTVTEHFVAGRLDIDDYLRYGSKYGYMQAFALYKINGEWTDNPRTYTLDEVPPEVICSHESGTFKEPITVKLSATDGADPAPRIYYTIDGSTPTTSDTYFVNQGSIEINTGGMKTLKYFSMDRSGNITSIETRSYGMEMRDAQPVIVADREQKKYNQPIDVRISASDDVDDRVTVHYTRDGSVPNENSPSFVDSKEFELNENGNYAISCMAIDSANNRTLQIFHYVVQMAPVTHIFPNGGVFNRYVEVSLSTMEPVEWIKYTMDGSDPDESHGMMYKQAFTLTETTTVKFRSMDTLGNLEDVKSAAFIRQEEPTQAVFENMAGADGFIMATVDGEYRTVADDINLAVGAGWDGRISRAIVSFDTSSLPQGATITRAYIQVKQRYGFGRPWDGSELKIDVKTGKFGSESRCQTGDWDEPATATGVATIDPFRIGSMDSSDFTREGREAISKTGRTQMRLYFDPHSEMGRFNYVFFAKGAEVKLFVEYID